MKKKNIYILIFLILIFNISLYGKYTNKEKIAEKYFSKAIKYYIEGKFDRALNYLNRVIQIYPENEKYLKLYDVILNEKDTLKVIPFRKKSKINSYGDFEIIARQLKNDYLRRIQLLNDRVITLINILSKENEQIKMTQKNIKNKLPSYEKGIDNIKKENKKKFQLFLIILSVILLLLVIFILMLFMYSRRIKKIRTSLKYLKLRQDEQYNKLLKIEEEQKRLKGL